MIPITAHISSKDVDQHPDFNLEQASASVHSFICFIIKSSINKLKALRALPSTILRFGSDVGPGDSRPAS